MDIKEEFTRAKVKRQEATNMSNKLKIGIGILVLLFIGWCGYQVLEILQ